MAGIRKFKIMSLLVCFIHEYVHCTVFHSDPVYPQCFFILMLDLKSLPRPLNKPCTGRKVVADFTLFD